MMTLARKIGLSAAAIACSIMLQGTAVVAAPLVTGGLTIYYDFDSFTDTVMDGSGNGFNGRVQDGTRSVLDGVSGHADLITTGVISNDTSNARRGAGAIRFTQPLLPTEDPVFLDMDGGVIKANFPDKLPLAAATYAAWVNLTPPDSASQTNTDGSFFQGSTSFPGHGAPHFQIRGDGRFRLTMRDEFGSNVVNSDGAPFVGHPYPNQPAIDANPATPPEVWPANTWFHLAATYDKAANDWALYYNGVEIRGGAPNGVAAGSDLGAWDLRAFGHYFDGLGIGAVYDSGGRRLNGLMDEAYIFNRALSAAEIGTLYNITPPGVNADYNGNGTVDAADYVLWRDGGPLQNDATAGVQAADYDVWRSRFGATAGSGAAVGAGAVPEPATIGMLLVACLGLLAGQRRR